MPRHMLWHKVARRLLDVPGTVAAPARDYISPIAVWDPEVVRLLMAHIAATTGRHWIDAVTREPHFSEFIAYGVFVDHVLGGVPAFDGAICHNYYERVPLSGAQAKVFAEQMPTDALGAMISSHSGTADDVRRDVFERCEAVVNGVRPTGAVGARPKVQQRQRAWEPFCLNGLLMLAHLFEFAPAV